MKLPDLPRKDMRWDRWEAFHWGYDYDNTIPTNGWRTPPFIIFDTGEVIVTRWQPCPGARTKYPGLDVRLVATRDYNLPRLVSPETDERVLREDLLYQGMQYLVVDHLTKHAVSLDHMRNVELPIPMRFRQRAAAYFPGPEQPPVGMPVLIAKHYKRALDKAEAAHIHEIDITLRMELTLTDKKPVAPPAPTYTSTNYHEEWHERQRWMEPIDPRELLTVRVSADLTPRQRYQLYWKRIARVVTKAPYLVADV